MTVRRPASTLPLRRAALVLVLAAAAIVTAAALAQAAPRLRAVPNPVSFGERLTVTGGDWPVNEFCRACVRISLRSDQNALVLGVARVRADGRFRFRWTPRRTEVGAGAWRLVARQRCQSGDDGSAVLVRGRVALRIR